MIKGVKEMSKSGYTIGEKYDLFKMTGTKRPAPKKNDGSKDNKSAVSSKK